MTDLSEEIKNLSISNQKEVYSIVFIGHVDAGKSTICGQILNQLDLIDKRTLDKYIKESIEKGRESWYLSWALDTNPEEREKGKTTEVGRAFFELESKKINILDAPGHKMFVSDMIVGANQADIGILVVSARINEFEAGFEKGGQTREHIILARAGKIKKIVVLVNKMDDESVCWSENRFNEIKSKLSKFLQAIYNDSSIKYIPVSGYKGINIKNRIDKSICNWYNEESFLEYLNKIDFNRERNVFVMSVAEKIKIMGNTMYSGKIESGILNKNQKILILPKNSICTVLSIFDEEDMEIDQALLGDTIKIKFKENIEDVDTGDVFCDPSNHDFKIINEFTCGLTILESKNIFCVGYKPILHVRMVSKECKILEIRTIINKKVVKKPFAKKGEKILAKIRVETPIALLNCKDEDRTDKFALRDEGMTVAIGVVRNLIG
ncbi:GTP binding domain of elongation factor Tu [Hamiltosporidium tvaerminnensis]|uniref:Elongation factor 1 alpha-like protein n=2 Tax=Hamiltosporidium TaxID=1176354 RepID=A0A4Q9LGF4_9MICR|nr:translation termination factor GTPase eRF3 [Hamiltosporidium tvaerminnensis]TBU04474.1 GTP binding domain of elongation factor Tu [Hamiltosporidium tvaerminnensis]TBU05621.1 GTP binding domain of elongation factor Tu [Hamiltosporidium magnivora]TBU07084.1 GTP binding domain of elongation factor Tu [Hamiltosporidium magnivora]